MKQPAMPRRPKLATVYGVVLNNCFNVELQVLEFEGVRVVVTAPVRRVFDRQYSVAFKQRLSTESTAEDLYDRVRSIVGSARIQVYNPVSSDRRVGMRTNIKALRTHYPQPENRPASKSI
jgi:hypothetical protein